MDQEANYIKAEGMVRKEESGQRAISIVQMRNDKDGRGLVTGWKKRKRVRQGGQKSSQRRLGFSSLDDSQDDGRVFKINT